MVVLLILSILVVGNFLRDCKSNYLEGALCVCVYVIVAVTTWYYPNPAKGRTSVQVPNGVNATNVASGIATATAAAVRMML